MVTFFFSISTSISSYCLRMQCSRSILALHCSLVFNSHSLYMAQLLCDYFYHLQSKKPIPRFTKKVSKGGRQKGAVGNTVRCNQAWWNCMSESEPDECNQKFDMEIEMLSHTCSTLLEILPTVLT